MKNASQFSICVSGVNQRPEHEKQNSFPLYSDIKIIWKNMF